MMVILVVQVLLLAVILLVISSKLIIPHVYIDILVMANMMSLPLLIGSSYIVV